MSGGLVKAALLPPWARVAIAVAGVAVIAGAGAAAWDRTPIIGPHAKIVALRQEVQDQKDLVTRVSLERDGWKNARNACEDQRKVERDQRSDAINKAEDDKTGARSDAFDQGYSAGRAVGRKQCGANREDLPKTAGPGPAAGVGGVRDLSEDWNAAAYRPAGALPR